MILGKPLKARHVSNTLLQTLVTLCKYSCWFAVPEGTTCLVQGEDDDGHSRNKAAAFKVDKFLRPDVLNVRAFERHDMMRSIGFSRMGWRL